MEAAFPRRAAFLAVCLLAAGACGDTAPAPSAAAEPPGAAETATAPPRAAAPGAAAATPAQMALRRAIERAADEDADETSRETARREVLAAGRAGIDAAIAWLVEHPETPANAEARLLLLRCGADAVPALAALLASDCGQPAAFDALDLLAELAPLWARMEIAGEVARAALDAADRDAKLRDQALRLLLHAGAAAAPLAPRLLEHFRGSDGTEFLHPFEHHPAAAAQVLHPVAAELAALAADLSDEERADDACEILYAMRAPPAALLDDLLRRAGEPAATDRLLAAALVAAWSSEDPRCATLARSLLDDPGCRPAVLEAWAESDRATREDALAAVRWIDAEDCDQAVLFIVEASLAHDPDAVRDVAGALATADPATARCLCRAIGNFHESAREQLVPDLVAALRHDDAATRVAAFEALEGASWDGRRQAADAAVSLLDDADPRVRAHAAEFALLAAEPPRPRVAAAARSALAALRDPRTTRAALRALRDSDPPAARAEAARLLMDMDHNVAWEARMALEDSPESFAGAPGSVAALLRMLRDDNEQERCVALLLRIEGGLAPLTTYVDERFAQTDRQLVLRTLGWVVEAGAAARPLVPSIERLRARDGYAGIADLALACLEPDDANALRRLAATLPGVRSDERKLADERLLSLGAAGAELCVRLGAEPRSLWHRGAYWVDEQPDAVRNAVAALSASRDVSARKRAADWTTVLGEPHGTTLLLTLLADADADVRSRALEAATDLQEDDAAAADRLAPRVAALLGDESPWTCEEAARFLARSTRLPPEATSPLLRLLDDPESDVRLAAAAALLRHGAHGDAAVRTMCDALARGGDPDSPTGIECARAVAAAGRAAAPLAPLLPTILRRADGSHFGLLAWIDASAALGPDAAPAVPALRWLLDDPSTSIEDRSGSREERRRAIVRALGAIGPAAAPALPDLRSLTRDARLRAAAEDAIRRIESAPR